MGSLYLRGGVNLNKVYSVKHAEILNLIYHLNSVRTLKACLQNPTELSLLMPVKSFQWASDQGFVFKLSQSVKRLE